MTALIAVTQRDRAYLATDAATYTRDGAVVGFRNKIDAVPQWPGVIAALGNAAMSPLLARTLALEFRTWDAFIAGAEAVLPGMIAALELPSGADIVAVGYSRERGIEAWTFTTDGVLPPGTTPEEAAASECRGGICQLMRLPSVVMSPIVNDLVLVADWQGIEPDDDPAIVSWSIRKYFEMARRTAVAEKFGSIGGFVSLASVFPDRIEQTILTTWPEDSTGGPLRPWPIDWAKWHAKNPRPKPAKKLRIVR